MKPKKNAKNKLKADLPPAPRKEEAKEKRKRPKKKEKVDVVVTEEVEITEEVEVTEVVEMTEVLSMEEKVEEALDVAVEESISHYDEEADEVVELQNSVYSLDLSASEQVYTTISMSQSFSEFGYFIPRRDEFKREEVDLRHAEMMKREYGWMTPSWVDAQLRSTPKGRVLKNKGDIVSPITNAKVLIEQGVISWEAPVWANAKLRKTPRGEAIKRAAMLSEEQRSILSGVAAEKEQETKN